MPRLSLFNSPLVLGFDHFERVLDRVSRSVEIRNGETRGQNGAADHGAIPVDQAPRKA